MQERDEETAYVPPNIVEAGCHVLYERVVEAHEPEWQELVKRMYLAMLLKAGYKPI